METFPKLLLLLSVVSPVVQSRLRTFHLTEKMMTQTEARAACRTNYTDLVTVYSDEENAALTNMTNIPRLGGAWIGLFRNQSSDKWSNGDNVTFSILGGVCGTGPCCAAMKLDGQWESIQCTVGKYFMCYKQDVTGLTVNYHLILENKTWYEAQRYCRKNYTDLVSIRDPNQNEKVKTEGMNSSTPFWIGLLRDNWEWSDGGKSAYRNWGSGHPRLSSSINCVTLSKGKWEAVKCKNDQSVPLCYRTLIHVSEDRMTWEDALDYCKQENRKDLLRIESESDQKEVEFELRKRNVSGPLWVGIGQNRLSNLLKSSSELALGPWSKLNGVRQLEPPSPLSCGATDTVEQKYRTIMDISALRAVCELKEL